jgi:hypothetical protein
VGDQALEPRRFRRRELITAPRPATAALAMPTMFVVMQVRQALQQAVATGACSPYRAAA